MKSTTAKFITFGLTMLLAQLAVGLHAQAMKSSYAKVRMVKGNPKFKSEKNAESEALKVNQNLVPGAVIECGKRSEVNLFFFDIGSVVKVTESTTLSLDKLDFSKAFDETVVEVRLDLKSGTILGNVKKLSAASKYEVKIPNGVCAIHGTEFRISANGVVYVLSGKVQMTYTLPGAQPVAHVVNAGQVYHPPVAGGKAQINALDPSDPVWREFGPGPEPYPREHFILPATPEPTVKPSQQPAHSDGHPKP